MVGTIARKEFVEMLRDGRFRWTAIAVATLLMSALATGWTRYRDVRATRDAAALATREQWLAQPPKNPHSAAHYGVYAFKPSPPLSLVDGGVSSYVGSLTWLEAHRQNDFKYRPAQDATAAARFGEWSAAAVLQVLVPLLVVTLGFGAFAGERERGTLRQLLSLGVPPRQVAAGKALGVGAALAMLLIPIAVLGAAALVLASGTIADPLARIAALATGYLAYFAMFTAITLAVSARASTSRASLVTLLAFWAVNAVGAPRLAADVARALHPAPSAFTFNTDLERALSADPEGQSSAARAREFADSVMKAYGVTSPDSLPVNLAGLRLDEAERHGDRVFDARYGALADIYRSQDVVRSAIGGLAPLLAVRELSMAMSGTDPEEHRRFQFAAERYRRDLVGRMNMLMATSSRTADGTRVAVDSTAWKTVPPFEYVEPALGIVLRDQWSNLLALAAWFAAGVGALLLSVRRMSPDGRAHA